MSDSICDILLSNFNVHASPGGKTICPLCGHKTLSIKSDNSFAKCFHPSCLKFFRPSDFKHTPDDIISDVADVICLACCNALQAQRQADNEKNSWTYLTETRKIHPSVIENSFLGIVPDKIILGEIFTDGITALHNMRLKAAESSPEIRSIDKAIDKLNKLRSLLETHFNWIVFCSTDADFRITYLELREAYAKNFASISLSSRRGVFGLGYAK